ncbi:hypothetical protein F5880DRAFT_1618148 [Lentinula raphanica]|nr:hypothetical protein F5880DRAFT_1618148 [Lentinula raphanica]
MSPNNVQPQYITNESFREAHHFTMNQPYFSNNTYYGSPPDIQLQLWQKLKPVPDSWLDKDKVCLQGTRTTVIEEISQWIESHGLHESQTFILCGEAGTGKSTISHTIGRNFEHILGAFFSFNILKVDKL